MLDPDLAVFQSLHQVLVNCDEFKNPHLLYALMGIITLKQWQSNLPNADSVSERVDLTIDYLSNKHNVYGENALLLLLQVLADRYAAQDMQKKALLELLDELRAGGGTIIQENHMEQTTRNTLLNILETRVNPAGLRKLAYKLLGPRAYDNLPGNTYTERCISFLEDIERQGKEKDLLDELATQYPDSHAPSKAPVTHIPGTNISSPTTTTTTESNTLTWLHLSDLHFRESRAYDEQIVLKELLHDIVERIEEDDLHPDFIAITGDLAFSGKVAEYTLVRRFFDDLLAATELSRDRLFVVPGNHDVDRNLVTNGAKTMTNALLDRNSTNSLLTTPADRQLIMARYKAYAGFVSSYFGKNLTFNEKQYFYIHSLNWTGPQVNLLGLNSAWVCCSDDDKDLGVLLGERQTRNALDSVASGSLKIALLHHPFDWLREFDQNDSAAMLMDNCDFVLHGHLHRMSAMQLSGPDTSAMVIGGGACYETRQYPNTYNFVRLELGSRTGTVHFRRYSDERGGFWAKDVLTYRNMPDGKYTFKF